MTVRRYSTASPVPAPASVRFHRVGKRSLSNGLPAPPGSAQPPACPDAAQLTSTEEKRLEKTLANCLSNSHSSKTKLFQEYVNKCRWVQFAFTAPAAWNSCPFYLIIRINIALGFSLLVAKPLIF